MTVEKKRSMIKCREVEHEVKSKEPTPTLNRKDTVTEKLMNCPVWITLSQAQNFLNSKLSRAFLKTTKL